jgi:hypothetical protein
MRMAEASEEGDAAPVEWAGGRMGDRDFLNKLTLMARKSSSSLLKRLAEDFLKFPKNSPSSKSMRRSRKSCAINIAWATPPTEPRGTLAITRST